MQLLLEFLPLAAFAIAYFTGGIYVATTTLMIGMAVSLAILRLRSGKFPPMMTANTALVLLLGAATLILRNTRFIQWKPSAYDEEKVAGRFWTDGEKELAGEKWSFDITFSAPIILDPNAKTVTK